MLSQTLVSLLIILCMIGFLGRELQPPNLRCLVNFFSKFSLLGPTPTFVVRGNACCISLCLGPHPNLLCLFILLYILFLFLIIVIVKINAIISPPLIHRLMTMGRFIPDTLTTSTFGGCVPGKNER